MSNTALDIDTDETTETGEPEEAHIVRTYDGENAAAKVLEARIYGTPLEAMCGHVFVPQKDPQRLPLCQKCSDIYEMYRGLNPNLPPDRFGE